MFTTARLENVPINRMCRCGDVFDPLPTSGRAQVKVKEAVLCLGKRALGGVPTYGDYGRFDAMERGVRGGLIYLYGSMGWFWVARGTLYVMGWVYCRETRTRGIDRYIIHMYIPHVRSKYSLENVLDA